MTSVRGLLIGALQDGQWHSAAEMLELCQRHIEPERAVRVREYLGRCGNGDPDQAVRRGKHRIVTNRLFDLHSQGYVEARGGKGINREYRLIPGCKIDKRTEAPCQTEK